MAEDIRKKNQIAAQKQAETREKERQEKITEINNQYADLTKRNTEYMIKLTRALEATSLDLEKQKAALDETYQELKEKQKQGVTAAKLYGPVAKKVDDIVNGPARLKAQQPPKFWEMALDNGLLMFVLFAAMYGIMGLFSKSSADAGWITLFVVSIIAGLGLAGFYKVMQQQTKHRILRGLGVLLVLLVIWFLAFGLINFIPPKINQPLIPIVDFILAAIGFGVRYILKKKLNIRSN